MKLPTPEPLGLNYRKIAEVAETIAQSTSLRTLDNFGPILKGMGGRVARVAPAQWTSSNSLILEVSGPRDFVAYLSSEPSALDRMLLACCLGHYLLHAREGKLPAAFKRFAKDQVSLEGLWFGMALVIPDGPFALAEATKSVDLDDELIAKLFRVPAELLRLKRKLLASAAAREAEAASSAAA